MALKIALLIDVQNYKVNGEDFLNIIKKLELTGEVVYGKVYNYSERTGRELAETIDNYSFEVAVATGPNKKNRKSFLDMRLVVDATRLITNNNIGAICLVCGNGDIRYLISVLRTNGKTVYGCFNPENTINNDLCDEIVALRRGFNTAPAVKIQPKEVASPVVMPKAIERKAEVKKVEKPKYDLATMLESFARRTSELNFESNDYVEEKAQLLSDIDECLNNEEFNNKNASKEEIESYSEIRTLVESLRETIKNSLY